jgi:hypothetical protein
MPEMKDFVRSEDCILGIFNLRELRLTQRVESFIAVIIEKCSEGFDCDTGFILAVGTLSVRLGGCPGPVCRKRLS